MDTMEGLHRSQYCAEVSEADNGKEVVLTGWVERRRDHGGLIFIDLRDRTGIVQVVASPDYEKVSFDKAEQVRTEYVLAVRGIVRMRDKDTINPKMKTGPSKSAAKNCVSSIRPRRRRSTLKTTSTSTKRSASNTATSTCAVRKCRRTSSCAIK